MKKGIIAAVVAVVAIAGITTVVLMHKKSTDKKNTTTSSSTASTGTGNNGSSSSDMNNMNGSNSSSGNGSSNNASSPVATDKVSIANFAFSSDNITVKKGTAVTWTNEDSAQHTVTIDSGTGPHSQPLNKGDTYTYTFSDAGTYKYHCAFHSSMTGTVTVTE